MVILQSNILELEVVNSVMKLYEINRAVSRSLGAE